MSTSQSGILALGTTHHHHIQLYVHHPERLLDALKTVRAAVSTVAGVNLVVGFAPSFWQTLNPDHADPNVTDFTDIDTNVGNVMGSTQQHLWLWFHGTTIGGVWSAAIQAVQDLKVAADLVLEQQSFVFGASQDLTGFEDGTENPAIDDAAQLIKIPTGQAQGGSVALLQRWVHNLKAFHELDATTQDHVIGRKLHDNTQLDRTEMSERAHLQRVAVHDQDGNELGMYRRSTAFGNVQEHGLMFVGFAPDQSRMARMLTNMAGNDGGPTDHLMDLSTAVENAYYYVPPVEHLP